MACQGRSARPRGCRPLSSSMTCEHTGTAWECTDGRLVDGSGRRGGHAATPGQAWPGQGASADIFCASAGQSNSQRMQPRLVGVAKDVVEQRMDRAALALHCGEGTETGAGRQQRRGLSARARHGPQAPHGAPWLHMHGGRVCCPHPPLAGVREQPPTLLQARANRCSVSPNASMFALVHMALQVGKGGEMRGNNKKRGHVLRQRTGGGPRVQLQQLGMRRQAGAQRWSGMAHAMHPPPLGLQAPCTSLGTTALSRRLAAAAGWHSRKLLILPLLLLLGLGPLLPSSRLFLLLLRIPLELAASRAAGRRAAKHSRVAAMGTSSAAGRRSARQNSGPAGSAGAGGAGGAAAAAHRVERSFLLVGPCRRCCRNLASSRAPTPDRSSILTCWPTS